MDNGSIVDISLNGSILGWEWQDNLPNDDGAFTVQDKMKLDGFVDSVQNVQITDLDDSGYTDLALAGPWGPGNCFEGNIYQTSTPPLLEQLHNCSSVNSSNLISRFPLQGDPSGLMMLAGFFADAQTTDLDKDNNYR